MLSFNSAVVKQKGVPDFSKAAGLVGANSQCLRSERETNLASLGSSTSIACGKLSGKMNVAFVAAISAIRWYSFPPPLIIN